MKIDIFGSCITRDAFNFNNSPGEVGNYIAWSSIVSVVSNPIDVDIQNINLPSNFNKRTVYQDLTKNHRDIIKNSDNNILIIDIFEERFRIANCNGNLFTYSNEYKNSQLDLKFKFISPEDNLLMLRQRIQEFKKLLQGYKMVILNKVKPTEYYIKEDTKELIHQNIDTNSQFLLDNSNKIFKLLEFNIPNLYTIELKGYSGSENHR